MALARALTGRLPLTGRIPLTGRLALAGGATAGRATTLLVLLLAGGCSGGAPNTAMPSDDPVPVVTSAPAEPAPAPEPSLEQESFTLGGVTLVASAASVAVSVLDDGTVAVDLTLLPDSPTATVAVEGPGALEAATDGTLLVLDEAGAPAAAAAPPEAGPADGEPTTVRMRLPDPAHAELELIAAGDRASSGSLRLVLADRALESATWGEREGGRSLAVVPTPWARGAGAAGLDLLWSELVATAPDADNQSMHDQLRCHALGAPDKTRWNLEPWRPDVGLVSVLAAACNP